VLNQASTESEHGGRRFHLVAYRSHRRLPVNGTTNFHISHLITRSGDETRRPSLQIELFLLSAFKSALGI
jgi:hypothetical protein